MTTVALDKHDNVCCPVCGSSAMEHVQMTVQIPKAVNIHFRCEECRSVSILDMSCGIHATSLKWRTTQ